MDAFLGVVMRWTHLASVVILLSAFFHTTFSGSPLDAPERLRKWVLVSVVTLVGAGLYNLLTKANLPPGYHMWFGIKILLALHVIAVAFLTTRPGVDTAKRSRLSIGLVYSALVIIAISAWLRRISLA